MDPQLPDTPVRKVIPFELFMGGISVYGIIVASLRLFLDTGTEVQLLFLYFDWLVCIVFAAAFLRHVLFEPRRIQYIFTWGILDLASALPWFPILRYLRIFRVMRIGWLVKTPHRLALAIQLEPSKSLLYLLLLFLLLIYSATCFGVLMFETQDDRSKIRTGADALWFGLVTVSTVGYGGMIPVTTGARICAAILMFSGIGVFASLAGFLLEPLRRLAGGNKQVTTADVAERLNELYAMLEEKATIAAEEKAEEVVDSSADMTDTSTKSDEST